MTSPQFLCANWNPDRPDCKKTGGFTCKNCYLVVYCGAACQKSHWPVHKPDCKSYLGKKEWQPDWALENRRPAFVGGDSAPVSFGGKKFLWGNMPAIDVLQLASNEGVVYKAPLRLLFAASGDLRNVVKTIAEIPGSYKQPIEVTINDKDLDIVARNVILLLIALLVEAVDEAVDCMIHVWYSALIRQSDLDILQRQIRPAIEEVCRKIQGKPQDTKMRKTWTFGQHSLTLVLTKSSWNKLLAYTVIPDGLTAERANQIRTAVTLAESRKDYRDRNLLMQPPSRRVAKNRFREDGLLLPFGSPRDDFQIPNPTFFQTADSWPMHDNADPLNGWNLKDISDTSSGPAAADIYGKLFYHVRAELRTFLHRITDLRMSIRLFQVDASSLREHVEDGSFDRIEVSNISDTGYLGIPLTLAIMIPLLQPPLVNPHATLITLFMNAVDQTITMQDQKADMSEKSVTTKRLLKYLPLKGMARFDTNDPQVIKFTYARDNVATFDHIFDRFMSNYKFSELGAFVGAGMKETHTVIEKWPYRLKLRPDQPGGQEEFDRQLSSAMSGKERYVEWKRTAMYQDEMDGQ